MTKKYKICKTCGNEILNGNYKYCSDDCKPPKNQYYKPVQLKGIVCLACGKPFKSKMKKRKYCSSKCKYLAKKERNSLLISASKKKICVKCDKEYMGPNHKYCSHECYLERNISISPEGITLKKCMKCKESKPLLEEFFPRSKQSRNGFATYCKICSSKIYCQWAASDRGKAIRSKNRKIYHKTDAHKQYIKKTLSMRRANETIRRRTDLPFALSNRMRCLMYSSLRGTKNDHKWQDLVGYSIDDLRRYIEKQFKKGMSWERFLAGEIHIDHKIPVSAFNFTKPEDIDFKKCWALSNLQPMWAEDNLRKNAKLEKHFQPALLLRARI